jgi:hypothetical protein
MSNADEFFADDEDWEGHPKLRYWMERLGRPEISDSKCELYRRRDGLAFRPAKIYMHFYDQAGQEVQCDADDWDDALNGGLVRKGIQAITEENEEERFALSLRAAFKRAEFRFGDGFFNSVLIDLVTNSPFAQDPRVEEVLGHVRVLPPNMESQAYYDCKETITLAIRGRAHELTRDLKYDRPAAERVLAGALARYVDERFSVSNRRLLGLL